MGLLAASSGAAVFLIPLYIVVYIVISLGVWGTFKKAGPNGAPAWAAFIPVYNFYVMVKVAGRPGWWTWFVLLPIIPIVGSLALLVIGIIVLHDVSKSFGHGGAFTVGLVLLSFIFWYVLWLGPSQYRGPAALAARGYGPEPGYPPQPGYPAQPGYAPPPPSYPPPGYPPPAPAVPPPFPPIPDQATPAPDRVPPPGQMPPPPE